MFTLTRKADYALVALTGLADRDPERLSTRELASRLQLPLPALRNILKDLCHHGLVTATHGARGGYRLARGPDQITVAQIVEAIEGPMKFALCCPKPGEPPEAHTCRLAHSCRIKAAIRQMHGRVVQVLDQVTLKDLVAAGAESHDSAEAHPGAMVQVAARHAVRGIGAELAGSRSPVQ
jgi:Rrf2 family protein